MELGRERRGGRADGREGEGASRERGGAEGERAAASCSSSSSRHRAGGVRLTTASKLEQVLSAGGPSREQFLPTGIKKKYPSLSVLPNARRTGSAAAALVWGTCGLFSPDQPSNRYVPTDESGGRTEWGERRPGALLASRSTTSRVLHPS